jgi:response regulator RpfG family c-di-GMP phosphodiesterase
MTHKYKRRADFENLKFILEKMESLQQIKDVHNLLDNILIETRHFTNSDAGTIFLVENNKLKFSYVQNDSIFSNDILCNKYIYSNKEIDINQKSLAGYVAYTGQPLIIDDAYNIDKNVPYTFNTYFDQISSYKTQSILLVPLKTSKEKVVGVIELINAMDDKQKVRTFNNNDKLFVTQFAFYASNAIEKALMLRDMVLRMINIAELRDPEETQEHVNRVGAYATEIYKKWADIHQVPKSEVTNFNDLLKIGAMLHDVGKVGIADAILKKKSKLTAKEFEIIKQHTILGARLFEKSKSDWEIMAAEITLNHHEKWDGTGYPGKIDNIYDDKFNFGKGKKGAKIPLSARIVSLADIFDALSSRRTYKDPWDEDKVLYYIKSQAGKQLDPELVSIFFEIYPTIKAITNKY